MHMFSLLFFSHKKQTRKQQLYPRGKGLLMKVYQLKIKSHSTQCACSYRCFLLPVYLWKEKQKERCLLLSLPPDWVEIQEADLSRTLTFAGFVRSLEISATGFWGRGNPNPPAILMSELSGRRKFSSTCVGLQIRLTKDRLTGGKKYTIFINIHVHL